MDAELQAVSERAAKTEKALKQLVGLMEDLLHDLQCNGELSGPVDRFRDELAHFMFDNDMYD